MESKKFGTGGNVNYTYGGKGQVNKQRTRGGSIYGVQKNIPNESLNKYVGKKEGGEVKHDDIKMDKKVVKKAVAMHDKQLHGGKKTDLKGLKKGGATAKPKRMFGGGMGMASGMGAGAGKLPPPSATNAAGNAAIGRATGITPPTGGPRGAAPTPAPNSQQTGAGSRMMESMMRAKERAAGRAPARQMGSVRPGASAGLGGVGRAVAAPTTNMASVARNAAKGANPLAGKKAPSQGRRMAKGGLAAGHKAADGIAKKGKTKGTEVKMARGGKTKKYC
jgi:hypothetical protein